MSTEYPDYLSLVKRDGWHYVTRLKGSGVVGIIAITESREVVLIEQFRVPSGRPVIEIPAGLIGDEEDANESALAAGERELLEETGFSGSSFSLVGNPISCSPGLTDETIQIVLAHNAAKVAEGGGVKGEQITVHVVPIPQLLAWLAQQEELGKLVDAKVFMTLAF